MDQFTTSSSDNELDNTSAFHLHELSKDVDESDEENISDDEDDKNNITNSLKNKSTLGSNNSSSNTSGSNITSGKSQLSASSSSTTPSSNDVPFSRIFVICGKDVTESQLTQAFQPFGTIESVKIVIDKDTRESKGYAYIKYQKASSAALAIEQMNGTILSLNGTNSTITTTTTSTTSTTNTGDEKASSAPVPLKVMIAEVKGQKSKAPSNDPEDSPPNSRLFVICKKDVSETDLTNRFKEFGNLEHVKIVRERDTHESKGYAFVKFSKSSTAALAMETINDSDDKSLKVIIALPKGKVNNAKPEATTSAPVAQPFPMIGNPYQFQNDFPNPYFPTISRQRLFVVCHKSVTQENLYKLFSRYPGMEYCDLKKDKATNKSKGFAYVNYSTPQAALLAKNDLNGIKYPSGYSLKVVFAEPLGIKQTPQSLDPTISSIQNSFAQMPFTRRNSNNDNRKRQKI